MNIDIELHLSRIPFEAKMDRFRLLDYLFSVEIGAEVRQIHEYCFLLFTPDIGGGLRPATDKTSTGYDDAWADFPKVSKDLNAVMFFLKSRIKNVDLNPFKNGYEWIATVDDAEAYALSSSGIYQPASAIVIAFLLSKGYEDILFNRLKIYEK